MEKYIEHTFSGVFWSETLRKVAGEMYLDRGKSSLYLWSDEYLHIKSNDFIHAQLHDLQKVSLLYLSTKFSSGSRGNTESGERRYFTELIPSFAVFGDRHITGNDKSISSITFVIHDSTTLFNDFDAFSILMEPELHIKDLVDSHISSINKYSENSYLDRDIPTGPYPVIGYFTGKTSLLSEQTSIGKVNIFNDPHHSFLGGASGFSVKNRVACEIKFDGFVNFNEAYEATQKVVQFFALIVGRRQEIIELTLEVKSDSDNPNYLDVYLCNQNKQSTTDTRRNSPHPGDVLINCILSPEQFALTLKYWLDVYDSRVDSKQQFLESFVTEHYSTDRLVKAANMFDILPDSLFDPVEELSTAVVRARDECKRIFKELPKDCIERNEILLALRNLEKLTLKKKIRHRAKVITDAAGDRFEQLSFVTDQAVDCRNFLVHGGKKKIDYFKNFHIICFFIDTLEFVFAASELIEAGWEIEQWINKGSVQSHPFGSFLVNYRINLHYLHDATGNNIAN